MRISSVIRPEVLTSVPSAAFHVYADVVGEYSVKKPTYPSDVLNAFVRIEPASESWVDVRGWCAAVVGHGSTWEV
jgi:hypothetical protein